MAKETVLRSAFQKKYPKSEAAHPPRGWEEGDVKGLHGRRKDEG